VEGSDDRIAIATRKAAVTGVHARAGQPAEAGDLVDVRRLVAAYYDDTPDPADPSQRVAFGTSGHRGSSLDRSFNEAHILAITQAICDYRRSLGIDGPLFIGRDTHALSAPAFDSALEVLAGNGVETLVDAGGGFTPTPVVSHAILGYNRGRSTGRADGIVVTPSHNPPESGGFKYNPPHGGPAGTATTASIETRANEILRLGTAAVRRLPLAQARTAPTTHPHPYLDTYVGDLASVIDMERIAHSHLALGVDPLGGAGVRYWPAIAERYGVRLTVVSDAVDPTFAFMTLDWDGRIRMDPSSPYAMRRLIGLKDRFDVALACDPDHDRHGIVTRSAGLLPPNHYLAACVDYLCTHRAAWRREAAIGKTVVSSSMIDRVAASRGRSVYEVPVGFKWFVDGLLHGSLAFGGEESAGASFVRRDGAVWTTDKDGIVAALLAAELTARLGSDPGAAYASLTRTLGAPVYERIDVEASADQKRALAALCRDDLHTTDLAGEPIEQVLTSAPGDGEPIGGVKVVAPGGWFAARPSGTEAVYKIYAESFRGEAHLRAIQQEARAIVNAATHPGPR
jgi:phosphoglucomutase